MSLQSLMRSEERFFILICLLVGLLLLVPILNRFVAIHIFLDLFLTAIAILIVYTISHQKRYVAVGVLFAIVMLASLWLQYFLQNKGIAVIAMIAGILFISVGIASILGFMFKSKVINREIIYQAILLYLLAALWWAFLYTFLKLVDPPSFNIDFDQLEKYFLAFQYYSFVTITTLGYGDITPVTEVAKAFSVLEAIVGQLYLVVAVAWLVGMHVSSKSK